MKRKILFLVNSICLAIFAVILTGARTAPCPYSINNTLDCPITVNITVYGEPPVGCSNACYQVAGIIINQHESFDIPCCLVVCKIEVTVTHLQGSPITPVTADFTSTTPISLPAGPPPCNASSIVYDPLSNTFIVS